MVACVLDKDEVDLLFDLITLLRIRRDFRTTPHETEPEAGAQDDEGPRTKWNSWFQIVEKEKCPGLRLNRSVGKIRTHL